MSKKKINHQWKRVTGDNLCPMNAVREQQNKSTLESPEFLRACKEAEVTPTKRQASKFRKKRGAAYGVH